MRVTYYQRHPQEGAFSVERLFAEVRRALPKGIQARVAVSRFASRGIAKRIYNIIEAVFMQGDINHVTGDVHFLAILLRKERTLLTLLDLVSVHRHKGWRRAVILFLWYWLPIKRVAMVSVISESTKNDLLRHIKIDPHKVRVIHCCIPGEMKAVAKEFNAAKPIILQIGTAPNKNLDRVAEALRGMSCHLRIVGSLDGRQVAVLGHAGVEYSGTSSLSDRELIEEYRLCDLLVFASTFEGFGMPIVEAQATGRPVVTSTVWSMPEVAGNAACLVDPFDSDAIRRGVLRVISDESYRHALIEDGYTNAQRFRPALIAQQYAQLYTELELGKRERARARV